VPRDVVLGKKTYKEHDLACPDCGAPMGLRKDDWGVRYRCSAAGCRGAHGAHPDGSPHGVPADAATRRARSEAHEVFDRTWKLGGLTRSEAYAWMRAAVGCGHVSEMSKEQCRALVAAVYERFPDLGLQG
jgi:predicted RNA-binding Zn-ribbon protein involved in translation (DUF1610 family)